MANNPLGLENYTHSPHTNPIRNLFPMEPRKMNLIEAFYSKDTKTYKVLKELNDAIADDPILGFSVFVIASAILGGAGFIVLKLAGVF